MTISNRVVMLLMIVVTLTSEVSTTAAAHQQHKTSPRGSTANRSRKVRELIHAAAAGNTPKVLQLLKAGVNVNAPFERDESELSGKTALMAAASGGHSGLFAELIKRGANVNLQHYSGKTMLMFAADGGDPVTIKALLRAGVDPNAKVISPHAGEITPLSITMHSDRPHRLEVVRILLAAGAEVNPKGRFFVSPLMHALRDLEMVKLLIAHGADVNQKNFRGGTALMIAAADSTTDVVKYLIEKGADVNARDTDGYTALVYAESQRNTIDGDERDQIIQVLKRAAGSKP